MALKETDSEQQREAFKQHLNDASEVVATWEPWERGILGKKQNGQAAAVERDRRNGSAAENLACGNNENSEHEDQ